MALARRYRLESVIGQGVVKSFKWLGSHNKEWRFEGRWALMFRLAVLSLRRRMRVIAKILFFFCAIGPTLGLQGAQIA